MALSSNGLGHRTFTAVIGVQFSLVLPNKRKAMKITKEGLKTFLLGLVVAGMWWGIVYFYILRHEGPVPYVQFPP